LLNGPVRAGWPHEAFRPADDVGWIPLTSKLFQKLPHHRATIASLILAWMFLPEYAYRFPGLPD